MLLQETYVDGDRNAVIGESEPYEPFTEDVGELFRHGLREYGRCTGHVYIDAPDKPRKVGWVFERREKYEDCDKMYLRVVWVTLHAAKPTVERTVHYHFLD